MKTKKRSRILLLSIIFNRNRSHPKRALKYIINAMDVDMEASLKSVETENDELRSYLNDIQVENHHLQETLTLVEKALEKEKKFHRKYAEEVVVTEAIRIEDFKKEKRVWIEENKALTTKNLQLAKDVAFYKKAHAELAKIDDSELTSVTNSSQKRSEDENAFQLKTTSLMSYSLRSTSASESQTNSRRLPSNQQEGSKALIKTNLMLFEENKNLKLKISNINGTVVTLKRKIKQLENFKNNIEKKKTKFGHDSNELEELICSSQKKNKDIFTPDVLVMLGQLADNKK